MIFMHLYLELNRIDNCTSTCTCITQTKLTHLILLHWVHIDTGFIYIYMFYNAVYTCIWLKSSVQERSKGNVKKKAPTYFRLKKKQNWKYSQKIKICMQPRTIFDKWLSISLYLNERHWNGSGLDSEQACACNFMEYGIA